LVLFPHFIFLSFSTFLLSHEQISNTLKYNRNAHWDLITPTYCSSIIQHKGDEMNSKNKTQVSSIMAQSEERFTPESKYSGGEVSHNEKY